MFQFGTILELLFLLVLQFVLLLSISQIKAQSITYLYSYYSRDDFTGIL
nr:MAG TPA: hypothetical protein [Caudoviricetes sp.]